MKSYKHLNKVKSIRFEYENEMMSRALPQRAFFNTLTSNIMLSMQAILVKAFKATSYITSYKSF